MLIDITQSGNEHWDIGIYGWWGHENFGGCLTYFALHETLKNMGYSVLMIQEALGATPARYLILDDKIATNFAKKHYDCSKQLHYTKLEKLNALCDTFIVGGDQMWNNVIPFVGSDNFLDFVHEEKPKLSYSTSFGEPSHNPPPEFRERNSRYLQKFAAISVREDYAVKIAKDIYNVSATPVIDAVFLPDVSCYETVAKEATISLAGSADDYLCAFILNPTAEKRRVAEDIARKLQLKLICIPDAASYYQLSFKEIFAGLDILSPLSMENFLYLFINAKYILTDSFHGTCMAAIFQKPFSVIYNQNRGISRFAYLNRILHLENRRIFESNSTAEINENSQIGFAIDFSAAKAHIASHVERSLAWLKASLNLKKPEPLRLVPTASNPDLKPYHGINSYTGKGAEPYFICPKDKCTGCGACKNICFSDLIDLRPDNEGFLYPQRKETAEKCTDCGLCRRVCPAIRSNPAPEKTPAFVFAAYSKDEIVRYNSTSGGAFTEIAKYVLKMSGVVYGVKYNSDWSVSHVRIGDERDLELIRQSKYYQSDTGLTFRAVKDDLQKGLYVAFCAAPCQCAGLSAYLRKDYPRLLIIDFICHSICSPKAFKAYLKDIENTYGDGAKAKRVWFKNKETNWKTFSLRIDFWDKADYYRQMQMTDPYFQGFLRHKAYLRPSCHDCGFKGHKRAADITLADFWGLKWKNPHFGEAEMNHGVSLIMLNSEKGQRIWDDYAKYAFYFEEHDLEAAVKANGGIYYSHPPGQYRDFFFENVDDYSFFELIKAMEM